MVGILATLLIVIGVSATLSVLAYHNILEIGRFIPVTCMGIISCLFLLGLAVGLNIAFGFCVVLVVALCLFGIYFALKEFLKITKTRYLAAPVTVGMFMILILYVDRGMLGGFASDDFTHWLYVVQEMVRLNDFGTNVAADAMFASYPPGVSLFEYFVEKIHLLFGGTFSEWRAFWAYHMLMVGMFFPFAKVEEGAIVRIVKIAILFIAPCCFYQAYEMLQMEPFLGIVVGCCFARIVTEQVKDISYHAYITLSITMLVMTKDSGVFFAVFIAVAYIVDLAAFRKEGRRVRLIVTKQLVVATGLTVGAITVPKILWNIKLFVTGTNSGFSQTVGIKTLLKVLLGMDDSYRKEIFPLFGEAFFSRTPVVVSPWDADPCANWLQLTYFQLCIVLLIGSILLLMRMRWNTKGKSIILVAGIFWCMFSVYIFGMAATYITNFSQSEALMLASFDRYISVVYLAAFLFCLVMMMHCEFKIYGSRTVAMLLLLVSINLIAPKSYMYDLLSRGIVVETQQRRAAYQPMIDLIRENCGSGQTVLFIDQSDWLYPYVTIRYGVRPLRLELIGEFGSWNIQQQTLGEDSQEAFESALANYDFIAIYNVDEYFSTTFQGYFEDCNIQGKTLYTIGENGKLQIVQ